MSEASTGSTCTRLVTMSAGVGVVASFSVSSPADCSTFSARAWLVASCGMATRPPSGMSATSEYCSE